MLMQISNNKSLCEDISLLINRDVDEQAEFFQVIKCCVDQRSEGGNFIINYRPAIYIFIYFTLNNIFKHYLASRDEGN